MSGGKQTKWPLRLVTAPATGISDPGMTKTAASESNSDPSGSPAVDPVLPPGTALGRYQIVELLGTGGGGRVYRARDPQLSRDVALKILHRDRDLHGPHGEYSRRLLREGKTLAKLSHPNVVAAYDVGSVGDSMFVAMELVPGTSLRVWLQQKRTRHEVLRVLLEVGRGLIAAHDAGVMHRDIKPANAMVAPDGSVRIVDFGLARSLRASADAGAAHASAPTDRRPVVASLSGDATETGLLGGTPGYIAPEVLRGEPGSDALADQFGYAVTLFVALTGRKPYAGETPSESLEALARGERAEWPRSMPRRIREVVDRGLALRASERYPNLRALVEALDRARKPSRRPLAAAAGALATLLLATAVLIARGPARGEPCQADTAAFAGVWDAPRRAALERALTATGRFNASEAFGLLAGRLDKFERDWLAMRQEACQATHVRGEQSERVLALRSSCLDRKLESVKALVTAFSDVDPRSVDRAAGASPDSIRDCADSAALLGVAAQLPSDPAKREAIRAVESGFALTRALIAAGRNSAIDNARAVLESAKQIGHEQTVARAVASLGYAISVSSRTADEHKLGEETLRESLRLAANVGDKRVLAQTASHLFVVLSYGQRRVQEADAMLPMVEAFVSAAGNDVEQRLEVLMGRGVILSQRRRFDEATKVFDELIALAPSADSELRGYGAYAQGEIGKMDLELNLYPEAVQRFQAELDGIRAELGNRHPRVIFSLVELALAQSKAGLVEAAWASVERIRELVSSMYPEGDWRYVTIAFVSGSIWQDAGECQRALPFFREAFEKVVRTYGATHSNSADVEAKLGACLHALGQDTEAVTHLERVLETRSSVGGAPNVVAEAAFQLADVLAGMGARELERAIPLAERALSSWREDGVSERVAAAEEWLARHRSPAADGVSRERAPRDRRPRSTVPPTARRAEARR